MRILVILVMIHLTNTSLSQKVFTAPSVEKSAEWANTPYKKTVKKAIKGDREALKKLITLYSVVEGRDYVLHSRTLLEVMSLLGDSVIAYALFVDIDKQYFPVLKKYLPAGQQLLENQALKLTALNTAFPVSWALLEGNTKPYELQHCTRCKTQALKGKEEDTDAVPKNAERQFSDDEVDPKLIKFRPDSSMQLPPDVEKIIDDNIKKQNEQKSRGGG